VATPFEHWWERRTTVILLVLLSMIPLLWPTVPPLVDLPGHMGRYRVQLDYDQSAILRDYYGFKWSLIGNLGVDLFIIPLSKLFGLELATKLIAISIPAMTVAGLLWIAREVNGRVPPTALFALPLAYGHPFLFGFINFALSMALALLAFALWLRLARLGHVRLRAAFFAVIGPLLWLTHTFGWGTLCVLAFSAELIRQHDRGGSWPLALFWAGVHCLSLAPPILLMLLWRSGQVGGQTADWFNWTRKGEYLVETLRDRFKLYDQMSLVPFVLVILYGLFSRHAETSRNLRASALLLIAVFIFLPRIVFGSAYADMRLTPYMIAIAVIAVRMRPSASPRMMQVIALVGLIFFASRITSTTYSFARASREADTALAALDHVPVGGRLITFVGDSCRKVWPLSRLSHISGMAIVRRQAFSNDQWDMAGAQLLTIRKRDAIGFRGDPSQVVTAAWCRTDKWRPLGWSLMNFPRAAFDYVWLVHPPRFDPAGLRGLTLVWSGGPNALYRVEDRTALKPVP
jgi:hypothetical protein